MNDGRHYFVVICMIVASLCMVGRIFYLTYVDREFLQAEATKRIERTIPIPTHRGTIFDRNGHVLSISTPMYSVWTDPSVDEIADQYTPQLATALAMEHTKLEELLRTHEKSRFVYLARRVNPAVAARVARLNIPEVRFETESRRYYPTAEVSAHVVGITDINDAGQEGLELSLDDTLRGESGSRRVLRNATGQLLKDIAIEKHVEYGKDVVLTIDLPLQYLAYESLKAAVEEHDAESASIVLVEVASGEIVAMTNYPSYNPNDPSDRSFSSMRNRAVTDLYEPGSTVKPFTALAALETGRYSPETVIDTNPGRFRVDRKLVEDPRNYGVLSLAQVIMKSSQVGSSKIALDIDRLAVYETLNKAGIEELPMTGLPGEVASVLAVEELKRDVGRVVLSYGYGLAVSPLQLAQVYLTLATGGVRRHMTITRGMKQFKDQRVFDEKDVDTLVKMLEGVVTVAGTASKADIEGFQVAGKTGTVRKLSDSGYDEKRHLSWFVGLVPAEAPAFVAVVVVDEPRSEFVGGGTVAAPVFKRVAQHALQLVPYKRMKKSKSNQERDAA